MTAAQAGAVVLESRGLQTGHRGMVVGSGIDIALDRGEVLCLLGPNGSGKTTLFRTLLGLLPPLAGEVLVMGRPVQAWRRNELAQRIGYVPQARPGLFPFEVLDTVLMGRAARLPWLAQPGRRDRELAQQCLARVGVAHLAARLYTELSGGEQQLVLIARALAQEPDALVMDEPTASLDFGNQIRMLAQIDTLRSQGMAVLMSTHQPEHAWRVADRVALLGQGRLQAIGPAQATASAEALAALYGVPVAQVRAHIASAAPLP